jgi:hypothetical protein
MKLATLAILAAALAKKKASAAAHAPALILQNEGGATASLTYSSSGGLEIRASKCVDRSSFCGRYKRSDCVGTGAAVKKMTFNTENKKHQHHIMLSDDGRLSFDVGDGGCVNPVASWDVVPDHGTKFNGESDQAFITTSSTGLDVMSQAGFTVNGDSIEPRCGCDHGTAATDSCTAHEDHHCASCDAGFFLAGKTCKAWQTCAVGSGMTKEGTGTADRECAPCNGKTAFSNTNDGTKCQAVREPCPAGEHITAAASASSDMICGANAAGTFTNFAGQVSATAWTTCKAGEGQTNTPSAKVDRTCGACTLGTSFSGADDGLPCTLADVCINGEYEKVAATPTSDRTCATHATACASHEYQSQDPTGTQDRECKQKVCHCP